MTDDMPTYESAVGIDDDLGPGVDEVDDDEPAGGSDDE